MSLAAPPVIRSARPVVSADAAVRELEEQLRATRQKVVRQRVGAGVCGLFCVVAVALGLIAALDYWLELSAAWRGLGLLAVVGGTIAAVVVGWRRLVSSFTLPEAARETERRATQFGQRLRTTLDYEYDVESPRPAQASRGLLDALHAETHQVSQKADWDAVVDQHPLLRAVVVAAGCFAVWIIALIALPEFRLAAGRALLLPLNYTTVTYSPESSTIKFGQSVTVEANVSGRPITAATLRHRPAAHKVGNSLRELPAARGNVNPSAGDSRSESPTLVGSQEWTTVDLTPVEPAVEVNGKRQLHGALTATLANLQQDQEFEVLAGPSGLAVGSIRVLQPLKLEGSTARIVPPAYTQRPEQTVKALELKVLEGSTVEIELKLNRPAAEGTLSLQAGGTRSVPVTLDGSSLKASLVDLRKSALCTISAKAADGMLLDPVKLSIKVQLDRPPSVQFVSPPEELSVTPLAEVPLIAEARDDLGLFKTGILYQVGGGELQPLWETDAAGSTEPLRGAPVLMLENHALTFRDAITYYAFAEDNYFGQPRRTTTPLRFIDIRPFRLTFQVSDGNCECQGQSVTLEELIQRQRQQLSAAFTAEQQGTKSKEVLERLATGEADLLAKSEEFWMGMEQLAGPIPALEEAVGQMDSAVTALKKDQLPEGVEAEQLALHALVRARENLRQKLSQSSSASQCQKFDRQQQQKLRMPEKKQQDEQQQVAETRKKLDDLAQREREWSQQAQQACQNPSSSKSGQPKPSSSSSASSSPSSSSQSSSSGEPMPMPMSDPAGEKQSPSESPSSEALAEAQKKMLEELAAIQKELSQLSKSGQAAEQQAQQAAVSMQQGLDELQKKQGEAAAEAGQRSADELEQLAAHLAAMNAKDVGQRLGQAQQLAQQLAARQEAVERQLGEGELKEGDSSGRPSEAETLAAEEQHLAAQTRLLAEQLAALERDAAAEPGGVGQKLAQLAAENPLGEIADAIQQAAEDLKSNKSDEARRGVSQTREQLQELSQQLGAARSQYAQPQLDELQKLEEILAQLIERGQRAKEAGKRSSPTDEGKWQQLAARLEALAAGDKRLAEALRRVRAAAEHRPNGQPLPPGIYPEIELIDAPNIREVSKALQAKIQEAILASALMDADQPVPPQYKQLVERYYRALSDDLR